MKKWLCTILFFVVVSTPSAGYAQEYVYLAIFKTVTAIPNDCYFDASTIDRGVSFSCKSGRILVGKYKELPSTFIGYVQKTMKISAQRCGLTIVGYGPQEVTSYLVHDGVDYLVFATLDDGIRQVAIQLVCENRKR